MDKGYYQDPRIDEVVILRVLDSRLRPTYTNVADSLDFVHRHFPRSEKETSLRNKYRWVDTWVLVDENYRPESPPRIFQYYINNTLDKLKKEFDEQIKNTKK